MKKLLLALIITALYNIALAGNYTTTGNSENWNSPAAWDCNCVPALINDNIVINHKLVRNGTLRPQNTNITINAPLKINGTLQFFDAVNFNVSDAGFLEVNNITITTVSALINLNADVQINNNLQLMNGYNLRIVKRLDVSNLNITEGSKITGTGKISWTNLQLSEGGSIVCSSGTTFTQANPPAANSLDLGGCVPLPVHFVSVEAVKNGSGAIIYWTTSMEENNSYFSIEKSINGNDFYSIGMVHGAGNSSSMRNYQFSDNSEGEKVSYYRIKQIDLNGNYEYSSITSVTGNDKEIIQIKNTTAVVLISGYTQIQIISIKGEVLFQQTYETDKEKEVYIELEKWNRGVNILKVSTSENDYNKRF